MRAILSPSGRPARLDVPRVKARYEGTIQSVQRGWISEQLDDTENYDLAVGSYPLNEAARISMFLFKNDPMVRGIFERIVTDIVGCGIVPIPSSTDKPWNRKAKENWIEASKYLQVNRRDNLGRTQRKIVRHGLLEGNLFILFVEDSDGKPCIQFVRQHRLKEIRRDKSGRPTSYEFQVKIRDELKTRTFPASAVWHWSNSIYVDAPMGEPILAPALNTARDMAEILSFEKVAVKDGSKRVDIIKTPSGELDEEEALRTGGATLNGSDDEDPARYYVKTWGPETLVLRTGDDIHPYEPKRPSPAWQGFMDYLVSSICLSFGYPPAVMMGSKMGGVDSRRDLATAQRTIEPIQEEFASEFRRAYIHLQAPSTEQGGALFPAPETWRKVRWQFPKPKTADYGREAQQDREDVREGLMPREEFWARQYQDPEEQEQMIVDEAVARKERIEAAGLTLDEFKQLTDLHSTAISAPEVPEQPAPIDPTNLPGEHDAGSRRRREN